MQNTAFESISRASLACLTTRLAFEKYQYCHLIFC